MSRSNIRRSVIASTFVLAVSAHGTLAQMGSPTGRVGPLPQGQRLDAKDGDVVFIRDDARVRVIRRREGVVRAIYSPPDRRLILLVDYVRAGAQPDGLVDERFEFREVGGVWPLGERWDGSAVLDFYGTAESGHRGMGIRVDGAFIQLLNAPADDGFGDERASAGLSYRGSSSATVGRLSFDAAERQGAGGPGAPVASAQMTAPGGVFTPGAQPVRVGGTIAPPVKIRDVKPVLPAAAAQAGIRGVVILEVTIAADGTVENAKVLRSIPLLDAAALDAVRQWRYTPTLVDGLPVSVTMTVTVNFTE